MELQAKKCDDVDILVSEKLNKDHLGVFVNSFCLSNYEYSFKTAPATEEEK